VAARPASGHPMMSARLLMTGLIALQLAIVVVVVLFGLQAFE
jgi:hypothetical protein